MVIAFEVCLILAIAELTSLGTTSPRYNKQTAIYFPLDGSHLTIWLSASKVASVISATLIPSIRVSIRRWPTFNTVKSRAVDRFTIQF